MDCFEIIGELEEVLEILEMPLDEFKKKFPDVSEIGYYPFRVGYATSCVKTLINRIKKGGE